MRRNIRTGFVSFSVSEATSLRCLTQLSEIGLYKLGLENRASGGETALLQTGDGLPIAGFHLGFLSLQVFLL